jgi:hypothetical protein
LHGRTDWVDALKRNASRGRRDDRVFRRRRLGARDRLRRGRRVPGRARFCLGGDGSTTGTTRVSSRFGVRPSIGAADWSGAARLSVVFFGGAERAFLG